MLLIKLKTVSCVAYSMFLCTLLWFIEIKRPSMKELDRYVTRKYAPDWYCIGIELGLQHDLDIIAIDNPQESVTCFQKTLDKWLMTHDATWEELEVVLTNVTEQSLDWIQLMMCMVRKYTA